MESNALHSLTPTEWRLVNALREVPESALRTRVNALVEGLIALAREPKCPEHMADGVPCASVHANCDQCVEVTRMLEGLEAMQLQMRGFPGA
ncbi:MAG TPA: hypothetical protein VMV60_11125 [Thermoanaerobaculia bacterium]|nr:hypothetical protein [Thermoanaerobaculia bacterium]